MKKISLKWKPVLLSSCLVLSSIGSPGKVFAETATEYVSADTVYMDCPLNQISTLDYNGNLSEWTEVTNYMQYANLGDTSYRTYNPVSYGNKISYANLNSSVLSESYYICGQLPYFTQQDYLSMDVLYIFDFGGRDISSLTSYQSARFNRSYPLSLSSSTTASGYLRSSFPDPEQYVNDGEQIWWICEGIRSTDSIANCFTNAMIYNSKFYLGTSGTVEAHIYYRLHDVTPSVNSEGGGSSGGGSGSGTGGGSSST